MRLPMGGWTVTFFVFDTAGKELDPRRRPGVDRKWILSNRALSAWISTHRCRMAEAVESAKSIRSALKAIFPILDAACVGTCQWCPEPCCIVARSWFDFRDLLFFHLNDLALPPGPLSTDEAGLCRYLGRRGCRLPRLLRPWACTQYLCATQHRFLIKSLGTHVLKNLASSIQRICAARILLEETFVEIVKRSAAQERPKSPASPADPAFRQTPQFVDNPNGVMHNI
jgi:hypothetical protein